jgi:hypothetical protein
VTAWYEQLRQQYRPDRLEVLLVGESPPDPGTGPRRFFYARPSAATACTAGSRRACTASNRASS